MAPKSRPDISAHSHARTRHGWPPVRDLAFAAAMLTGLRLGSSRATLPPDAVMPVVASLFLALAGVVRRDRLAATAKWTRATSPTRTLPGALTLIGLCAAATIDPDQMIRALVQASSAADQAGHHLKSGVDETLATQTTQPRPGPSGSRTLRCRTGNSKEWPDEYANESRARSIRRRSPTPSRTHCPPKRWWRTCALMRRAVSRRRGEAAARAIRPEPAQERARDAVVEAPARAVRELPRHHPAGRDRHFGDRMAAAGPARERATL